MASLDNEWETYKTTHNKKYDDAEEEEKRKALYYENKKKVEEHNKRFENGEETFTMELNKFSDQFPEEMKSCCGVKSSDESKDE